MKAYKSILKKENFDIYWHPCGSENKGVKITINATNPFSGKEYRKYAGWIGASLALHGGQNTPDYVFRAACEQIAKHKTEVEMNIINFLEQNNLHNRAQHFIAEKARCAGRGVTAAISHPVGEKQRRAVRQMMQQNAPAGTRH